MRQVLHNVYYYINLLVVAAAAAAAEVVLEEEVEEGEDMNMWQSKVWEWCGECGDVVSDTNK